MAFGKHSILNQKLSLIQFIHKKILKKIARIIKMEKHMKLGAVV